jgi:hypothetical protein
MWILVHMKELEAWSCGNLSRDGPTFALCTKIFMTERSTKSCRPLKAVLSSLRTLADRGRGMPKVAIVLWYVVPSVLMKCMGAHLDATGPVSQASTGLLNAGDSTDGKYQELSESQLQRTTAINQRSCYVY